MLLTRLSLSYWANLRRGYFQISGQSLIKRNCLNSWTSDKIDMKLGPVTKLDKRNKTISKNFDDDVTSENCDVIAIFPIYGQFGAIWNPDSGRIVCKIYISTNSNLLSYKNSKQSKKNFNKALTLLLWVRVLFWPKNAIFCKTCWHQQN